MDNESFVCDQVLGVAVKFIEPEIPLERMRLELETEFSKIGLNSVTFTHFLVALEKEFGFEFEDEKLLMKNYKNLEDIIAYIKTRIDAA